MQLEQYSLATIEKYFDSIRQAAGTGALTNYFRQPLTGNILLGMNTQESAMFINDDMDFFRLYFCSKNRADLARILSGLALPGTTVIDYISKEDGLAFSCDLKSAGFEDYAIFVRLVTYELKEFDRNSRLSFGQPDDLETLWRMLHSNFDKFVDHFPSKATLLELIEKQQVILNRDQDSIKGYIIFRLQGSKVNFNYFFNRSDNFSDAMMLLHNFYAVLKERGVKSGFQWNNVKNVRVRQLHRQFGWKEDGMKDFFFIKRGMNDGGAL